MSCNCLGPVGNCPCMRSNPLDSPSTGFTLKDVMVLHQTKEIKMPKLPLFSQRFDRALDGMLDDIKLHIRGTLDPAYHYVQDGGMQTIDKWHANGSLETTARDTAEKYLDRYGKKAGKNKKDLLKAIHYVLMMYYLDHLDEE